MEQELPERLKSRGLSMHLATAFTPMVWMPVLILYAFRARLILHRWPSYDMPDPKLLHLDTFDQIVGFTMDLSLYSILVWPILTVLLYKFLPPQMRRRNIVVFGTVVAFAIACFVFDPTGFVEWYFD